VGKTVRPGNRIGDRPETPVALAVGVTETHCPYCALQCGITLTPGPGGRLALKASETFPVNRGGLCAKGFSAAELLDHPERLRTPLIRGEPASWDDALTLVADTIMKTQRRYGPDSVGAFGGGGLTNEKAYTLGKFVRVALRSASIDDNGRFCMSSAAAAANRSFGVDRGLPFPLEDVAKARTLLIVGANPADAMPPSMTYFEQGRANGAKHIVVDPRRTATALGAYAHLQALPGTDLALANGMLHVALREGLVDEAYVRDRTTGFEQVRAAVNAYWPERVERMTGVSERDLRMTVRLLAGERPSMILTARGAEQHSNGTDTAQAFLNLALALGLVGGEFEGYGTITGQGNGQGGREHGQKADQLPGYRRLDDPAAREHVAGVWGVDASELPQPGLSAYEMLDRLGTEGGVRTLLVLASNIAVSAPHSSRVIDRLRALDLLVVCDFFPSETALLADVVLPTAQWAEEEGTMTNLEGRVIRRRRAAELPEGVRTDLWVLRELAERLGRGEYFSDEPREVFEELRRASAGGIADYSGITYELIERENGVFWPCPTGEEGTPRLFADRFPTPGGRARFVRVEHRDPHELPDKLFPYVLTTGRLMNQYQSGAQTRRTAPGELVAQLHPDLARRHGIADGDRVELRTRRGSATMRARTDPGVRPDTIFAPFHWPGTNVLTDPALDRFSRMPAFKACAVAISRAEGTV
jgi:assimilatory nitrate reductase catalytic subunit